MWDPHPIHTIKEQDSSSPLHLSSSPSTPSISTLQNGRTIRDPNKDIFSVLATWVPYLFDLLHCQLIERVLNSTQY